MSRLSAVLVVLLVVTAGCSSLDSGGGNATPEETVTPVPVDDGTATTAPVERNTSSWPSGIGANGSVAMGELTEAHTATLQNTSYTWVIRYNVTLFGGRVGVSSPYERTVKVEDDHRYLDATDYKRGRTDTTRFANRTAGFTRLSLHDRVTYQYAGNTVDSSQFAFEASDFLAKYLSVPSSNVSRIDRDEGTFYRIYARQPALGVMESHDGRVRNYSATAYVTPDGFVRALSVSYDLHESGRRTHVDFRFDYHSLGETTVETPDWVSAVPTNRSWTPTGL